MMNTAPLIIVGSRLQALILLGIALSLVFGLRDQLFWSAPAAAVLAATSTAVFVRRLELHADRIVYRRLGFGTVEADRSDVEASAGHRYLSLTIAGARNGRIEVPVEIRPQVREWAEWRPGVGGRARHEP